MQTSFTAQQLADADVAEADANLRRCVHCGFCNATCPTFLLHGDELEGPRGRIYLIKELLEHDTVPGPAVVRHLDSCLSCLACMSTCPSGVDYRRIIDLGRSRVESGAQRPPGQRLLRGLLARILPRPRLLRPLLRIGRIAAHWPLPRQLRTLCDLARRVPPDAVPLADRYGATGSARGRVALLAGCVQQALGNEVNHASVRLLTRLGFEVEVLRDGCCGAIAQHLGHVQPAHAAVARNVRAWSQRLAGRGCDVLLVNASGCGTQLKDYGHLLRADADLAAKAADIAARTRDLGEFLLGLDVPAAIRAECGGLHVACQTPCSLRHGQRLGHAWPALLRAWGFSVTVPDQDHLCCGSAGTYNLLQPDTARRLGELKAVQISNTGAAVLAGANLGCMIQLRGFLSLPIVHGVQLLDWAADGPRPPGIA